jgi:hypothetical protein
VPIDILRMATAANSTQPRERRPSTSAPLADLKGPVGPEGFTRPKHKRTVTGFGPGEIKSVEASIPEPQRAAWRKFVCPSVDSLSFVDGFPGGSGERGWGWWDAGWRLWRLLIDQYMQLLICTVDAQGLLDTRRIRKGGCEAH